MRFELRRLTDYSDEAILGEIRRVAAIVEMPKLSIAEFRKHSRVSPHTVRRRFGGWEQALTAAGCMDRFDSSNRPIPEDEIISELQRVGKHLGIEAFTRAQFNSCARFSDDVVRKRFGTWHQAMTLAGLSATSLGRRYSDDECFENLLTVWTHYGRPPLHREMMLPPSSVGPKAYTRRFGTWTKALHAFVDRVNSDDSENDTTQIYTTEAATLANQPLGECDQRSVRLGLRFDVLKRDRFRCVVCGRSPATHLGLVLHVDHVVPVARGGKTVMENLRSLCSECNLGKGAKHDDK